MPFDYSNPFSKQMDTGYRMRTPGYPEFASARIKQAFPHPVYMAESSGIPLLSDAASMAIGIKNKQYGAALLGALPFVPGTVARPLANTVEKAAGAPPLRKIIHGSPNPNMTLDDVQVFRNPGLQKQGKRGRVFGGFYGYGPEDAVHAEKYAKMQEGTPTLYEATLHPDARIKTLEDGEDITRLSQDRINGYLKDGYKVVSGKGPFTLGRTEHAVIDKSAISSWGKRQ